MNGFLNGFFAGVHEYGDMESFLKICHLTKHFVQFSPLKDPATPWQKKTGLPQSMLIKFQA